MCVSLFVCVCGTGVRVYQIGNTLGLYADLTHGNKSITSTHFIFLFPLSQKGDNFVCEIVQLIGKNFSRAHTHTYLGKYVLAFI